MQELFNNFVVGLIPDWLWAVIGVWPWIAVGVGTFVVVSLLYQAYRVGGWPGLSVVASILTGLGGYIGGRLHTTQKPAPKPAEPVYKKRKTLKDVFNGFKRD